MKSALLRQRFPRASYEFIRSKADDASPKPFVPIQPKTVSRTNRSNDGRSFQNEIKASADAYRSLGLLKLEKVDPPVKSIGNKMIRLENPFPDFVGVGFNGRALAIEAKSTSTPRLPLGRDGGLTVKQCNLLRDWHKAGAITGVLWRFENKVEWLTWLKIDLMIQAGHKSLLFGQGQSVGRGLGFVAWDFANAIKKV